MIELRNVQFLKSSVDAISSFIPEGNFRFNDKGIHFRAIDPSQILLVDYFIDKSVFEKYDVESAFVGINLSELGKIFARAMPNDSVSIDLSESELKVTFKGELERSFKVSLVDIAEDEQKLPDEAYDSSVDINARLLREVLKDASVFSSSVVIRTKGEKFYIESKGNSGAMNMASQSRGVRVKSKAESVSKYSLGYLQNIVKEADPESHISLQLKSDSPMKISYKIGQSDIKFYLAHMLL